MVLLRAIINIACISTVHQKMAESEVTQVDLADIVLIMTTHASTTWSRGKWWNCLAGRESYQDEQTGKMIVTTQFSNKKNKSGNGTNITEQRVATNRCLQLNLLHVL